MNRATLLLDHRRYSQRKLNGNILTLQNFPRDLDSEQLATYITWKMLTTCKFNLIGCVSKWRSRQLSCWSSKQNATAQARTCLTSTRISPMVSLRTCRSHPPTRQIASASCGPTREWPYLQSLRTQMGSQPGDWLRCQRQEVGHRTPTHYPARPPGHRPCGSLLLAAGSLHRANRP